MANPRPKAGPGRPKGSLNKITLEIKEIAQRYGERAIIGLASLAEGAESESARVAAWKELLDRGYGKSPQAITHSGDSQNPLAVKDVSDIDRAKLLAFLVSKATK
jgi:hypothetical protein